MSVFYYILPFIVFVCALLIIAFLLHFRRFSASLKRLVYIIQKNASLFSGLNAVDTVTPDFASLEKALRAMTEEFNIRFKQAKSEGSRLEAILNGMSEAVFAMDFSLKLHLVNPKARTLFNLDKIDVRNVSLLEATRSTDLVEIAKTAIHSGSPLERELTFFAGSERHFWVNASPLRPYQAQPFLTAGQGQGVVLVLQDVTRLIKLERIRKDFVANVSHELRTPIQIIKGFSETLLDIQIKQENEKDITNFISIIHKNVSLMETLTNDLLTLASLENGGDKILEVEEHSVIDIVNEVISLAEHQAKEKQIKIKVDCPKDLKAKLHGSFITQALNNLIDNGIKYSSPQSKIWINAYQENAELIFEVRDKGIGIPAEHLNKIFERFYRVDRTRSRKTQTANSPVEGRGGGTGLGLSIVRHIVLLHKGNAEVESHAGEGSIFRIKIPF
ncbi:MAG: ATP-binding protein [Treponema sp.]|nr:ATP-binding protein [Treponema sp.]